MFALTLRHPWAWAVHSAGKRIENRDWLPPSHVIGQWVALHGGVEPKAKKLAEAEADLASLISRGLAPSLPISDAIMPGIVGVFRLDRVIHVDDANEPLLRDRWFVGPYGWVMGEWVGFDKPVATPGAQKLWQIPPVLLGLVRERYAEAKAEERRRRDTA